MSEIYTLCKALIKEINRINSGRTNKISKKQFKELINIYIDDLWKQAFAYFILFQRAIYFIVV